MSYHAFMAKQADTQLLPAYLVVGDDSLKKEAVLKRMRIRLEELGDLSFNSDTFNGESATGAEIVTACQTIPFASEKRLVQVNDAEKLKKADSEELVAYLQSPAESTVLMLVANKLAKSTRLYKAISALSANAVLDCGRPDKKKDMLTLVRKMGASHGLGLTDGAAATLVEFLGDDTVRLDNELKKIALSVAEEGTVSEEDIRRMVSREAEVKPWDLTDALAARDLKSAILARQGMPSASPYALLGRCVSSIRDLMGAQSAMASGGDGSQLASMLKIPDWKAQKMMGWARGYSAQELRAALASALVAEKEMKSGADPDAAFDDWMISVISK